MTPKQLKEAEQDRAMRAEHWAFRMPQMMASASRRPFWQFRSCGDSRDPPECAKLSGFIAHYDSSFWKDQGPVNCKRLDCRCTIRTYSADDLKENGLSLP